MEKIIVFFIFGMCVVGIADLVLSKDLERTAINNGLQQCLEKIDVRYEVLWKKECVKKGDE